MLQESFEVRDGIAVFRPVGECTLVEAVDAIRNAIGRSRAHGVPRLLVTGREVHGFPVPSLVDRFLAVEDWAEEAQGMVLVALVVQPQYIHPGKFGVKVASDFGLTADVFTSETHAKAWLMCEP